MDSSPSSWAVAVAIALAVHAYFKFRSANLRHIPTVGASSDPLLSYIGASNMASNHREVVNEGYSRFKGKPFKIPAMNRWIVILSGHDMVDEIRRFPDDMLSFQKFAVESINMRYTIGTDVADDPYHHEVISKLTKNLANIFPLVREEVEQSFEDEIGDASDWVTLSAQRLFMTVVARASNRVFVGESACQNEHFLNLAIKYTLDVVADSNYLNIIPAALKPIVGRMLTKVKKTTEDGAVHLRPIIEQRLEQMKEYGEDYPSRPEDMLQWLLDAAIGTPRAEVEALTRRIMHLNFAAIHTSSSTILHAVYHLVANPEYAEPLRKEVLEVIETDGWTKVGMTKMYKVDSFLREAARYNSFVGMAMQRVALQDITLSTGDFIPKGTFLAAPAYSTHWDNDNYEHPEIFNPWRFADEREHAGESAKHQFVNTNPEYIAFGHGRHACPGRFFAANELKLMLAHLVLNYDIKLPGGSRVRPENVLHGASCAPNPAAKICLRKRQV